MQVYCHISNECSALSRQYDSLQRVVSVFPFVDGFPCMAERFSFEQPEACLDMLHAIGPQRHGVMAGTPASNFEDPGSNSSWRTALMVRYYYQETAIIISSDGPYQLPCASFPVVLVFDTVIESPFE